MAWIVNVKAGQKNENEKLKVSGINYMESYAIIYLLGAGVYVCMFVCPCVRRACVCRPRCICSALSKAGEFLC